MRVSGGLLDWIEQRLGPYPFSSFGILVVDSTSGMETQTMVTLGNNGYILSPGGDPARDGRTSGTATG